ncbi:hypothetical protein J3E69DRAFT_324566 [Trichoderma sp. SZMC 28015]
MADAEKHTIIAENILNVFDLVCEWSLHDEDETLSAAMMAVALLATPGFDECGLPQSWFDFAEKYPKVAATVRAGAKAFAIPGNTTMEKECEKGLPILYILNPIYQSGVSAQSSRGGGGAGAGAGAGDGAAGLSLAESAPEGARSASSLSPEATAARIFNRRDISAGAGVGSSKKKRKLCRFSRNL